jgi:hypothetical protein
MYTSVLLHVHAARAMKHVTELTQWLLNSGSCLLNGLKVRLHPNIILTVIVCSCD